MSKEHDDDDYIMHISQGTLNRWAEQLATLSKKIKCLKDVVRNCVCDSCWEGDEQ